MNNPRYNIAFFVLCCCFIDNTVELEISGTFHLNVSDDDLRKIFFLKRPKDCADVKNTGNTISGVYEIWPVNSIFNKSIQVYCDMDTDRGGWIVIQRRGDYGKPQDYFYKTWAEYKQGFGSCSEDFWLGNDLIHALTCQDFYCLRVDMKDQVGGQAYAHYGEFYIKSEKDAYQLIVSKYSGTAGDSLAAHNGMKFSTKDVDNDKSSNNCSSLYKGGWWYNNCHNCNPNGLYLNGVHKTFGDGVQWSTWKDYYYSLPFMEIKIRPCP